MSFGSRSSRVRIRAPWKWRCGLCWAPAALMFSHGRHSGNEWVTDAISQLPLTSVRPLTAPYGELPDLNLVDSDRDVIFTWNGTSAGVRVPLCRLHIG